MRTVDDAGLVQIEGAYYAAGEAALASVVTIRVYAHTIEIVDGTGAVLRRHQKALRKGAFVMAESDRLFNLSRHTARVLARAAQIGPQTAALAQVLFARLGRPGQRALYGLASLPRTQARADIEAVCARLLAADCVSHAAIKTALARRAEAALAAAAEAPLTHAGDGIRPPAEYQTFFTSDWHGQFECPLIVERTRAGMSVAKRRGTHVAHPRKLSAFRVDHARRRLASGKESQASVASLLRVGVRTPRRPRSLMTRVMLLVLSWRPC